MEYRQFPRGSQKISVIGMGTSAVSAQSEKVIMDTFEYALENGINFIDTAGNHAATFPALGKLLFGCRKDVMLQIHFGANYLSGDYGWTTNLDTVKRNIAWELDQLKTDYIDFGFIHCLDEADDFKSYERNGVLQYVQDLQAQGVIRHLALSTHAPEMANRILDRKLIDLLMFSINPMYDYGRGAYAIGGANERFDLYRRCEKEGIGITVMKPFNAGMLLDARKSPFGKALTAAQCVQYALDRPGVLSVLPGAADKEELKDILHYFTATDEEKDYSVISSLTPDESVGKCVYCKHCHPCPAGLDIGLINKYYDLARLGDDMAKDHYLTLNKTARDCISCKHCDKRCPFHVAQSERMQEIRNYFGK